MQNNKIRIAVLFGGKNGEHEVSRESAASILTHLDRRQYEVVPVKIGTDGCWMVGSDAPEVFEAEEADAHTFLTDGFTYAGPDTASSILDALDHLREVDLVFPALHGPYGEDGTLQAMLETFGVPFVGNGVLASAVGMDKEFAKKLLAAAGLSVADSVVLRPGSDSLTAEEQTRLDLPVFVKPSRSGSSVGVSRVDDWEALPGAVAAARQHDRKVLVEAALTGREIDLGVLERPDGTIEVGPSLEIKLPQNRPVFDYEAKYGETATVFEVPAKLPADVAEHLQEVSRRAFLAVEASGLLRVDLFVQEDGTTTVNEVNTFPGFTSNSQYPRMWKAAGLDYPNLLDTLIETALSYATNRALL